MENGIYKAISAVLSDVGAVGKDGQNTFDKYKYRSIDAVMNAMHPAMAKHGVFVTPEVLEQSREERSSKNGGVLIYSITKVKYTFYTADGSSVTATVIGEGMDKGDKSMNKAMSAAFKYALFQVFCIPTEEFVDSETESPEPEKDHSNELCGSAELAVLEAMTKKAFNVEDVSKVFKSWPNITKGQYVKAMEEIKKRAGKNGNEGKAN
jgi:hypothetical protein